MNKEKKGAFALIQLHSPAAETWLIPEYYTNGYRGNGWYIFPMPYIIINDKTNNFDKKFNFNDQGKAV